MDSKEIPINHNFTITKEIEVGPEVIENAKKAASMVWNKNIGEPTQFNFRFISDFINKEGQPIYPGERPCSAYNIEGDYFRFAIKAIEEKFNMGIELKDLIILVAAHETQHKVQIHKGENPKGNYLTIKTDNKQYHNDPHEKEAWDEALHVFKAIHPNSSGTFSIGGDNMGIPEKSRYI